MFAFVIGRNQDQETKKKKWWVRDIYKNRSVHGKHHALVKEMLMSDRESFFR